MRDIDNGMAYSGWFDELMSRPDPEEYGFDEDYEREVLDDLDAMRYEWR